MAHENGEFVGNNQDLFNDVLVMLIKKLPIQIEDGAGRLAEYIQTTKQVRSLKSNGSFVQNLSSDSIIKWDMSREDVLAQFNFQKIDATPEVAACLDSMIETLENEV